MASEIDTNTVEAAPASHSARATSTARFRSVLFEPGSEPVSGELAEPESFSDLNLDQIWAAVSDNREHYELSGFFYQRLSTKAGVEYRHDVFRDLEREEISRPVYGFARAMTTMRQQLERARKLRDRHQRERWFISAVRVYCDAVSTLTGDLSAADPNSVALVALRQYLHSYIDGAAFKELEAETGELEQQLAGVRYTVLIRGLRVTVQPYDGQPDLSVQIEQTFAKFRQGAVKDHRVRFRDSLETDTVEQRVLSLVAQLNPELFSHIAAYVKRRERDYLDAAVVRFDREVQFYLAYLEYIDGLKKRGLAFCYPAVSETDKRTTATQSFDLALAHKLVENKASVVANDVQLHDDERIIVVTGPNQGGKTTFARMFGQLHHLAAIGVPVPGREAELFLADQIFTHFEREEDLNTLRSKFEDELARLHTILEQATSDSVLVMNESFSSTTLNDAWWVGQRVLKKMIEQDMICLLVTFIDEFASAGPSVVSMMSTVDPDDVTRRTFEVVRKPADGLAYAVALAEKHGVSYEQLKNRLAS